MLCWVTTTSIVVPQTAALGSDSIITVIIDVGLCAKSAQFSSEQSQSCHRQRRGGQYAILLAAVPHKCIKLNAFHCRFSSVCNTTGAAGVKPECVPCCQTISPNLAGKPALTHWGCPVPGANLKPIETPNGIVWTSPEPTSNRSKPLNGLCGKAGASLSSTHSPISSASL